MPSSVQFQLNGEVVVEAETRPTSCSGSKPRRLTSTKEVHGMHVVTVEGLSEGDTLHPAQAAMVRTLGSQCGYCTPDS